jgi:hypothetical protein
MDTLNPMNVYAIWVDLIDGREDLQFAKAIEKYLNHFKDQGLAESWTLERRKLGFGPAEMGEFQIRILTKDLDTLDKMFRQAATRSGEIEMMHSDVYRRVKNFKAALYRSFPDEVRKS